MEQKYVFSSNFPCLVFCNKEFLGELNPGDTLSLSPLSLPVQIDVHPKSVRDPIFFIPFTFTLSETTKSGENFLIFDLFDGNYEVEISPKLETHAGTSFEKIYEKTTNNKTNISVQLSSLCKITLENTKNKVEFCPKHILSNIVCKTFVWDENEYFVLTAKTQTNKSYLFVANTKKIDACIQKVCDDLFFELPKITTFQKANDHFHHIVINVFKLHPNGLEKIQSYSSRKEAEFVLPPQKEQIGRAFFECVGVRDFELARSILTNPLSQTLSDEHLKRFFPRFKKIKIPPTRNDIVILHGEEDHVYKLTFLGQKIDNIEIVER